MLHLVASTTTGTATCSRCTRRYTHRSLIVRGAAGAGDPLCPGCATRTSGQGRRLAAYVRAELRATATPAPTARRGTTTVGAGIPLEVERRWTNTRRPAVRGG